MENLNQNEQTSTKDSENYVEQLNPNFTSVSGGTISDYCYNYTENIEHPKKLTVTELREFKGCANISDKRAMEITVGLFKLSLITYKTFK